VLTNVLGTWNVIEAAVANDVAQFVLISTDKAVAPSNVMGATKRIAESLLDLLPGNATRMTAVRFGNVLGSAGSVVPIFRDQIARGGPVTVTHPDVNLFMTIPEAVQLVLHSAAIGMGEKPGVPRKFLLEMGEPVKIADLARQMILLSGKSPDTEIVIHFSGLKPGEKLAEVLIDEDEVSQPRVDGINEVTRRKTSVTAASLEGVSSLIAVARGGREGETTSVLNRILAEVIGRPSTL
jgi:O-antigen biosynthesis protein WbqV